MSSEKRSKPSPPTTTASLASTPTALLSRPSPLDGREERLERSAATETPASCWSRATFAMTRRGSPPFETGFLESQSGTEDDDGDDAECFLLSKKKHFFFGFTLLLRGFNSLSKC